MVNIVSKNRKKSKEKKYQIELSTFGNDKHV